MLTAEEVAAALGGKRSEKGWKAKCPAHDDKHPSLAISSGEDGKALVFCHAGCTKDEVWNAVMERCGVDNTPRKQPRQQREAKLVVPVPAAAPPPPDHPRLGEPTTRWKYRNEMGQLIGYKARWDLGNGGKEFRPQTLWRTNDGKLEWRFEGLPKPRPLYHLDELTKRQEAPVLIVEGEKAADAAVKRFRDHSVTTWQDGTGGVGNADWTPLKGRRCIIWPDADVPGEKAAEAVAAAISNIGAAEVRIVELPGHLPKGWDLADDCSVLERPPKELIAEAQAGVDPTLARLVLTAPELAGRDLPEREYIIEPWLPCAGLAMIFAARGVGKTYLAMSLGIAVASGSARLLGHYPIPKQRRVLYIDGELPLVELQGRVRGMGGDMCGDFLVLSSEDLFREDNSLNIHEPADQRQIDAMLAKLANQGRKPDLIVIDSLSTLSSGVDENDNSALDELIRWLIQLRLQGYTVLLLHHAGKGGDQRGASRREDLLDTSIKLDAVKADVPHDGAHFKMTFSKTRGQHPQPNELECKLGPDENGRLIWATNIALTTPAWLRVLREIHELAPKTQKELADRMVLSEGSISQRCRELREKGALSKPGLAITGKGRDILARYCPDLAKPLQMDLAV